MYVLLRISPGFRETARISSLRPYARCFFNNSRRKQLRHSDAILISTNSRDTFAVLTDGLLIKKKRHYAIYILII